MKCVYYGPDHWNFTEFKKQALYNHIIKITDEIADEIVAVRTGGSDLGGSFLSERITTTVTYEYKPQNQVNNNFMYSNVPKLFDTDSQQTGWKCTCGSENKGNHKFCAEYGKPKPANEN